MKKVVTLGGGTGHHYLLRGLKNYDLDLTAVVSMIDNGGSTGELRTELGVLAPGDLRNCLLALADETEIKDLTRLFEYRFSDDAGKLANHNAGNIILAVLDDLYGDMAKAVAVASKILRTKGRVFPVSLDDCHLFARTESGKLLKGEVEVSYPEQKERISEVWLEPKSYVYGEAAKSLREADIIVICPGDLYGSVIPNFLTNGVNEAIRESKAKVVYVCNLVTKQGTYDFKVSDFVKEIERYSGRTPDYIVCNVKKPSKEVVDKYKKEASLFVEPDILGDSAFSGRSIGEDLLIEREIGGKRVARHDSAKIARIINSLAADDTSKK